jgi:uncharacterized protein YodC (DUF2158 family)
MELAQISAGMVVRLKSGSPSMTVAGEDGYGNIICQWFDGKKPMNSSFAPEVLEVVPAAEPPAVFNPRPR